MKLAKLKNLARSYAWWLGRKLYMWGCADVPNAPESNAEYWMLRDFIRGGGKQPFVLFDIGCDRGNGSTILPSCG